MTDMTNMTNNIKEEIAKNMISITGLINKINQISVSDVTNDDKCDRYADNIRALKQKLLYKQLSVTKLNRAINDGMENYRSQRHLYMFFSGESDSLPDSIAKKIAELDVESLGRGWEHRPRKEGAKNKKRMGVEDLFNRIQKELGGTKGE